MSEVLVVNEMFSSIQGEGLYTGIPAEFLRLQGCNLRCAFCDTEQAIASQGGEAQYVEDVTDVLTGDGIYRRRLLLITGGEPLLQFSSLVRLSAALSLNYGWRIHVETNGTVELTLAQCSHFDWITVSPKGPKWDCKVPYEAVSEVKFVMGSEEDYHEDLDGVIYPGLTATLIPFLEKVPMAYVWLQPDNNRPEAVKWCLELVNILQDHHPFHVGLSVQMHKFIGAK